jgi:outer membrane cobalamin receptor
VTARRALTVVLVPLTSSLLSCSRATANQHREPSSDPSGRLITAEQIERSGGRTAWEVLQREAPVLTLRENRNGQPASTGRRGRTSIYLEDALVIVLDGIKVGDWRSLDQIPASQIFSIFILTGIEGTTYYGTNAVDGGS